MFHRSQSTLFFLVAFVVALAVAAPGRRTEPPSSCGTGPQQCCNSVQEARDVKSDALGVKNVAILLIALLGLKPDTLVGRVYTSYGRASFFLLIDRSHIPQ
ncbi:hypothetical protein ONZ45_g3817 [Pleurotus djamor]|nr:hypothetical protein ONZ45_g3817 [Pleurotus djamor]